MAFRKKRKDPFTEIQLCLQKRDYKGALDWFSTLLKKDPKNTQIRLRFADTLVLAGRKRDAVEQFRVVADELSNKGFMIRAIAIHKKILQLDPDREDIHRKLAELSGERSAPAAKTTSLRDALTPPDAPLHRSSEETEPKPKPPEALPQLSLEESMAMEFGAPAEEVSDEPAAPAPPDEGPPVPAGSPPAALPDEPSFDEEPLELGGEEGEPARDEEVGEVEIVLEAELAEDETEVVALDPPGEGEPEESAEPLLAALGEDIDSLIDSIIDDVGSSATGAPREEEEPPTHIPLFSDLTTAEFIDVALLLLRRVAKAGETIVREGDPGDSMFIVSTGEVEATVTRNGRRVRVATMKDGDFFGEMAALSNEPRTATVTASKSTELLELSRDNLLEICSRHPHVEAKIRLAYDERAARAKVD